MGWFQDARGNRFFTDFRDIDMREMKLPADFDRLFRMNKRQDFVGGSLGFSDVAPRPTATGGVGQTTIDVGDNVITSGSPSGSSTPASQDAASATESSAGNVNQTTPSSGGLTQAAKIGIGLGVPLGLIVLGALIFGIYWYGKRQGRKKQEEPVAQTQEVLQSVPEADGRPYYGNELWTNSNAAELPGNKAVHGMPQRPPAAELHGNQYRY
jgi:hypothetical protein